LMVGLFYQSASAQAGEAEAQIARACDSIATAYRFYSTEWSGPATSLQDTALRASLTTVVQTDAAAPVQGVVEAEDGGAPINIYMVEGQVLPFEWRGTYWPVTAGWQMLHTLKGDTTWVYFWPRSAWAALYRQQRLGAEVRNGAGAGSGARAGAAAAPRLQEAVAIPAYWFYGLFLVSVLFLWVERKMAGMNG